MRISDWSSDVCSSDLGHLRTIDQTGCGASSAPIPERNVVIVIDLYAAPGADLREAGGKAGPHQADMARKCGIDMLLNKLWYRHLCSLSCTSMLRRVSIAWLSHVSKRCEMPRQAQPCRCISGLEFGIHAQAVHRQRVVDGKSVSVRCSSGGRRTNKKKK